MFPAYVLFTALFAQFTYILINWYFFRRREYFFYTLYILAITFYFLNKYLAAGDGTVDLGIIKYSKLYPDKILAIISYIFYFKFGRYFVEAKTRYPSINKLMQNTELVLSIYLVVDFALLVFTGLSTIEKTVFLLVNISIFVVLIFVFKALIKRNETLDRFILTGSAFFAICACATMWLGQNRAPLEDGHVVMLQFGAIVEMIFLNVGLVYKSKIIENESAKSQKKLIEKYAENEELLLRLGTIRERISRDLHDDVGATLSSVKAYSEILKDNPNNLVIADLIKENSTEMLERLEEIAWATNPRHDNLKSLQSMMIKFAAPLCHARNIHYHFENNVSDEQTLIPGEVRQNVYLIFKEAINNMIKYANASSCNSGITIQNNQFELFIMDNGEGSASKISGNGNGWTNMKERAEDLNGKIIINDAPAKGVHIIIQLPFPFKIPNSWDKK